MTLFTGFSEVGWVPDRYWKRSYTQEFKAYLRPHPNGILNDDVTFKLKH